MINACPATYLRARLARAFRRRDQFDAVAAVHRHDVVHLRCAVRREQGTSAVRDEHCAARTAWREAVCGRLACVKRTQAVITVSFCCQHASTESESESRAGLGRAALQAVPTTQRDRRASCLGAARVAWVMRGTHFVTRLCWPRSSQCRDCTRFLLYIDSRSLPACTVVHPSTCKGC